MSQLTLMHEAAEAGGGYVLLKDVAVFLRTQQSPDGIAPAGLRASCPLQFFCDLGCMSSLESGYCQLVLGG